MPIAGIIEEVIDIPEGVEVKIDKDEVTVSANGQVLTRSFRHPLIEKSVENRKVVFRCQMPGKKEKAMIGTFRAHMKNMIYGVTGGYECRMRVVYSHFPIKTSVKEKEFLVENFLGERHPRRARIVGATRVKIEGDIVLLSGPDKEHVGQSAANIEQATKIRGYDPRVFQDGIYITQKPRRIE